MKMTPVRLEERDLIDLSIMAEIDFNGTWLELNNRIKAYHSIYETYRKNILDRIEDFKSNLSPEPVVWLFARREVQLLLNAWKVLNELLLSLRVKALPLPDESFKNEDLIKAGLTYQNIYGTREMTEGKGRYDILTGSSMSFVLSTDLVYAGAKNYFRYDSETGIYKAMVHPDDYNIGQPLPVPNTRIYELIVTENIPYSFVLPEEFPFVDPRYPNPKAFDPGMATGHETEYLFRSKMLTSDESVSTQYDMCWLKDISDKYYSWDYQPVSSYTRANWYYAYKVDHTGDFTVERITEATRFTQLQVLYGQMYLCIAKYTYQDVTIGIGYDSFTHETATLKLRKPGEASTMVGSKEWIEQVYYATEFCPSLMYKYRRYDPIAKKYVEIGAITSKEELQTAMDTYGTVYKVRLVNTFDNVEIYNIMDFIYDVIDWRHVDIANVKCRECGHTGMIDNPGEFRSHWLVCPNCGNYNAYAMEFPTIAHTDFIRPLFKYDPNYTWYDIYINNKSIHNELSPVKMWKGRFGHGSTGAWTQEIDDLMYHRSLRESEWDHCSYDLAGDVCLLIDRYNLTNKFKVDELLTLFTEKDQAKALFQVGNIWACRHEIIRVLCTQLMKIHQKGVLIK